MDDSENCGPEFDEVDVGEATETLNVAPDVVESNDESQAEFEDDGFAFIQRTDDWLDISKLDFSSILAIQVGCIDVHGSTRVVLETASESSGKWAPVETIELEPAVKPHVRWWPTDDGQVTFRVPVNFLKTTVEDPHAG